MLFNFSNLLVGTETKENEDLKKYTTIKTGGRSKYFFKPYFLKDLTSILDFCKENNIPYKIIGGGSNLVFSDGYFDGAVISLKGLNGIFFVEDKIRVFSGVSLVNAYKFALSYGYSSFENLVGIPATIGGMTVMNAGAFNKNISDDIYSVTCLNDGKIYTYSKKWCNFSYRKSRFSRSKDVILYVDFKFNKLEKNIIIDRAKYCFQERINRQPKGFTAGSTFKNPKDDFAGRLIEKAGLKGERVGGAFVSDKHANFILNDGTATSLDVYLLTQMIKDRVLNEFGINLETEIEFVGEF